MHYSIDITIDADTNGGNNTIDTGSDTSNSEDVLTTTCVSSYGTTNNGIDTNDDGVPDAASIGLPVRGLAGDIVGIR